MNEEEKKTAVEKMKLCIQCPHFFKPTKTCKKCGCFMPIKVRVPSQKCPVDKW